LALRRARGCYGPCLAKCSKSPKEQPLLEVRCINELKLPYKWASRCRLDLRQPQGSAPGDVLTHFFVFLWSHCFTFVHDGYLRTGTETRPPLGPSRATKAKKSHLRLLRGVTGGQAMNKLLPLIFALSLLGGSASVRGPSLHQCINRKNAAAHHLISFALRQYATT
jgi:hypothetical protein